MTELLIFWTVVLVIAGALAAISDIFDDRDGRTTHPIPLDPPRPRTR